MNRKSFKISLVIYVYTSTCSSDLMSRRKYLTFFHRSHCCANYSLLTWFAYLEVFSNALAEEEGIWWVFSMLLLGLKQVQPGWPPIDTIGTLINVHIKVRGVIWTCRKCFSNFGMLIDSWIILPGCWRTCSLMHWLPLDDLAIDNVRFSTVLSYNLLKLCETLRLRV